MRIAIAFSRAGFGNRAFVGASLSYVPAALTATLRVAAGAGGWRVVATTPALGEAKKKGGAIAPEEANKGESGGNSGGDGLRRRRGGGDGSGGDSTSAGSGGGSASGAGTGLQRSSASSPASASPLSWFGPNASPSLYTAAAAGQAAVTALVRLAAAKARVAVEVLGLPTGRQVDEEDALEEHEEESEEAPAGEGKGGSTACAGGSDPRPEGDEAAAPTKESSSTSSSSAQPSGGGEVDGGGRD